MLCSIPGRVPVDDASFTVHHSFSGLRDLEYVALLLVPSCVGGFPVVMLPNMFVRAVSDHLTTFVHLLLHTKEHHPPLFDILSRFLNLPLQDDPDLCGLIRDPYLLPLNKPPQSASVLRSLVKPILRRISRNVHFLDLLEAAEDPWNAEFIESLKTASPLHIRLINELWSSSPAAIVEFLR